MDGKREESKLISSNEEFFIPTKLTSNNYADLENIGDELLK